MNVARRILLLLYVASGAAALVYEVVWTRMLGLPAAAMGATFPLVAGWLSSRGREVSAAGSLYAANTFGAAFGAIAAGFWLIPALGLRATTWVGVGLNCVAAAGALWLARQP